MPRAVSLAVLLTTVPAPARRVCLCGDQVVYPPGSIGYHGMTRRRRLPTPRFRLSPMSGVSALTAYLQVRQRAAGVMMSGMRNRGRWIVAGAVAVMGVPLLFVILWFGATFLWPPMFS